MRIGLTYDLQTDPTDERQAEFDPPRVIEALRAALESLGHETALLGGAADLLRSRARLDGVELVFNIAEGGSGRCREAWVPVILERRAVPYVGSGPTALAVGLDKVVAKKLAVALGIPTPRWLSLEPMETILEPIPLRFPLIVKPRDEGSGFGIDSRAVVHGHDALHRQVAALTEAWSEPVLVEEFVGIGELTVCVIGNDPPVAYPAIQRPVDRSTRLACHIVERGISHGSRLDLETPLELTEALDGRARQIAVAMFRAVGCRDMARVDLRVDGAGEVFFLEINPLPTFDPDGSLGLLAEYLGISYAQLVGRVLQAALTRLGRPVVATTPGAAS